MQKSEGGGYCVQSDGRGNVHVSGVSRSCTLLLTENKAREGTALNQSVHSMCMHLYNTFEQTSKNLVLFYEPTEEDQQKRLQQLNRVYQMVRLCGFVVRE